jgi:hypothetical protein
MVIEVKMGSGLGARTAKLLVSEIESVYLDGSEVKVVTANRTYVVEGYTLAQIEALMDQNG